MEHMKTVIGAGDEHQTSIGQRHHVVNALERLIGVNVLATSAARSAAVAGDRWRFARRRGRVGVRRQHREMKRSGRRGGHAEGARDKALTRLGTRVRIHQALTRRGSLAQLVQQMALKRVLSDTQRHAVARNEQPCTSCERRPAGVGPHGCRIANWVRQLDAPTVLPCTYRNALHDYANTIQPGADLVLGWVSLYILTNVLILGFPTFIFIVLTSVK